MALTPEMVANKRFTPVRLREGYDMGEVDGFLDEVEEELNRLARGGVSSEELEDLKEENEALSEKLKQVHGAYQVAQARVTGLEEELTQVREALADAQAAQAEVHAPELPELEPVLALDDFEDEGEPEGEPEEELALPDEEPVEAEHAHANWPPAPVTTTEEASDAARRLLELATTIADELVTETNREVEALRAAAEANAEETVGQARESAEATVAHAEQESERMLAEANASREEVLANVEAERQTLAEAVESLQSFENEYRRSLAEYFAQQLAGVQGTSVAEEVMARYEDVNGVEDEASDSEAVAEEGAGNDLETAEVDAEVIEEGHAAPEATEAQEEVASDDEVASEDEVTDAEK